MFIQSAVHNKICRVLLAVFFGVILTVVSQTVRAAELWSVGKVDGSCAEFALPGDWNQAAKVLPSGTVKKIDGLNPKTDWPWIQAGPVDVWGGSCKYSLGLQFDIPNLDKLKASGVVGLELQITAAGHPEKPPTLTIDLNGTTQEMKITPCGKGGQILAIPTAANWKTQKVLFPIDTAKETGNLLQIINSEGDWMVYDAVQLLTRSEKITNLGIKSQKGWLRNKDKNPEAIKKFTVDFGGDILTQPGELAVKIKTDEKNYTVVKKLDPKADSQEVKVEIPMDVSDKPMEANLSLTLGDRVVNNFIVIPAERKWELHIIHQTHLDIGYTHKQEEVLALQVQSIKDSLKYIEETKNYPEDAKFKFHPEGMWAVDEFMKTATEDEKKAFLDAARKRYIHLDVLYAQAMTGMYSDEELFELMGSAIRFGRKYGVTIDSAMQSDVPGYVWGLVPVLAKCGVHYMTMAPNPGHRVGRVFEWGDKPFYWESPSGKEKVLCWIISTSYNMFHFTPIGSRIPEERIFGILADFENKDFPYDIAQFRYCIEKDNGRPNRVISDVVKEWNEKYVYPKLILSRNSDVMKALEAKYRDKIPTIRGDYTPYWEDGAASTSKATGINRLTKSLLPIIETFLAVSNPQRYIDELEKFDSIWTDVIMYDEHTWGAHNSISEPESEFVKHQDAFKQNFAFRAFQSIANDIREMTRLFTPETVKMLMKEDFGNVHVDSKSGVIGNDVLTLKIDTKTGAISSLKRKGIDEDFVKPGDDGNSGLNDYLCILGRNANENRSRIEGDIQITSQIDPAGKGGELIIRSTAPNCQSLTRSISVSKYLDVVKIRNTMEKKLEYKPEGVFFGFPFNIPGGQWKIDTPWALVEVEKDQLPGGNRNFYCVQRFCNYSNGQYGVNLLTTEAPMIQFAPIMFTPPWDIKAWRDHIEPGGTVYSWVCNNHWETNYKAGQEGKLSFSYVIQPYVGRFSDTDVQRKTRLAPLHSVPQSKLLGLDNENIFITRLKPCREYGEKKDSPYGSGLLVRLYNPTKEPQTVKLDFRHKGGESYDAVSIYNSNPLEDRLEKISSEITIDPLDFITLRAE